MNVYKIKSPLADPNSEIISYYSPRQAIKDGLTIDPLYQSGYYCRHIICKPYKPLLTADLFNLIEKAADSKTGHSDRQGIYTDLLTCYQFAVKQAARDAARVEFTVKINNRNKRIVCTLEPLDATPDPDGYMFDETPCLIFDLAD
jgi:hypothetical protein